jgi:hypothetical protein
MFRRSIWSAAGAAVIACAAAVIVFLGIQNLRANAGNLTSSDTAITLAFFAFAALIIMPIVVASGPRLIQFIRCCSRGYRQRMIEDLDSPEIEVRRNALQTLVDFHGAPFGHINCWPFHRCTYLQMRAMEALMGRWLEVKDRKPAQSEEAIAEALFRFELGDEVPQPPPQPPAPPAPPGLIEEKLDRIGEVVKNALLDWNADALLSEETPPLDDNAILGPFDRGAFAAALGEKVAASVEHATENINQAQTVGELADCEAAIGEELGELREEAVNLALEMRGVLLPTPGPSEAEADVGDTKLPRRLKPDRPWPPAPEFPGRWVKLYRRLRRAGL